MQLTVPLIAALALGACNQIYGLEPTKDRPPIDAQYFDAPADAPFACPSIGQTPVFAPIVHQIDPPRCHQLTLASAIAAAACDETGISVGMLGDKAFSPVTLAKESNPRLTPDGDQLWVARNVVGTVNRSVIDILTPSGSDWVVTGAVTAPFEFMPNVKFGTPSAGPLRRVLIVDGGTLYELEVSASGAATEVAGYSPADLGIGYFINAPNLSPDGLRFNVQAFGVIGQNYYVDRASIQERWQMSAVRTLPGVPTAVDDVFMTADCARVYFSAIGLLFWEQQGGVQ